MNVTNKIEIHLDDKRHLPPIDVMQGDSNTRVLEFSLYSGAEVWNVPDGVSVAVAYVRRDGAKGIYDTLADGSAAISVAGDVVSATLVPQALAVAGDTKLTVVFMTDGEQLATFCVTLRVASNPAVGAVELEDYINLRQHIAALVAEYGAAGTLRVTITEKPWAADKTFAEIYAAYEAGQSVECVLSNGEVLALVGADPEAVVCQSVYGTHYSRVVITADDTVRYNTGNYADASDGDFCISVWQNGDGYTVEETMAEIQAADEAGRTVYCVLETDDQQWIYLPMVQEWHGVYYFSAVCDGVEWLGTITADADGNTVATVTQRAVSSGTGDGYTPVKGVDYWTDADKAEMVADVLAALESSEEVAV